MELFDILAHVEDYSVQLDRARAVLQAAIEEVEDYSKYQYLRDEHVNLLLHAADSMLYCMEPELKKVVDALLEKHKEAKKIG